MKFTFHLENMSTQSGAFIVFNLADLVADTPVGAAACALLLLAYPHTHMFCFSKTFDLEEAVAQYRGTPFAYVGSGLSSLGGLAYNIATRSSVASAPEVSSKGFVEPSLLLLFDKVRDDLAESLLGGQVSHFKVTLLDKLRRELLFFGELVDEFAATYRYERVPVPKSFQALNADLEIAVSQIAELNQNEKQLATAVGFFARYFFNLCRDIIQKEYDSCEAMDIWLEDLGRSVLRRTIGP